MSNFHNGSGVKETAYNAGDIRDTGFDPGWRGYPGGGNAIYSRILAWKVQWTEEPGGLQSKEMNLTEHEYKTTDKAWKCKG